MGCWGNGQLWPAPAVTITKKSSMLNRMTDMFDCNTLFARLSLYKQKGMRAGLRSTLIVKDGRVMNETLDRSEVFFVCVCLFYYARKSYALLIGML